MRDLRDGDYCALFGFDREAREQRLALLDLHPSDHPYAVRLQETVIQPQVGPLMEAFYATLMRDEGFAAIVNRSVGVVHLKQTQTRYLLSLGVNFDQPGYFNERLRVGLAHARVGVPLSLYQCAYRLLQQLLIDAIPGPSAGDDSRYRGLLAFVLKITALDMSLAIETYHRSKLDELQRSLDVMHFRADALQRLADQDDLTGLANRRHIIELLERYAADGDRRRKPLCLLMADLDFFKHINDAHGHLAGDRVLHDVTQRIRAAVRHPDLVGRYGGEEFVVILPDTELAEAVEVAERIRQQVQAQPITVGVLDISITISLGVAQLRKQDKVHALLQHADSALYRAKESGRNRVVAYGGS